MSKIKDLKVGDLVTRMLGGAPMPLKVTEVTDTLVICGWWTFDRETGVEEDPELGWGRSFGVTGSFLKEE